MLLNNAVFPIHNLIGKYDGFDPPTQNTTQCNSEYTQACMPLVDVVKYIYTQWPTIKMLYIPIITTHIPEVEDVNIFLWLSHLLIALYTVAYDPSPNSSSLL